MFRCLLDALYELYHVPRPCAAVARKAAIGVALRVDLEARLFVIVERATEHFVPVGFQTVVVQNLYNTKLLLDLADFHAAKA